MNNTYTCAFCGKEYNTPEERMHCENVCYKTQEEEKRKAEQSRVEEEKRREREKKSKELTEYTEKCNKRLKEILRLVNEFNKDYKTSLVIKDARHYRLKAINPLFGDIFSGWV